MNTAQLKTPKGQPQQRDWPPAPGQMIADFVAAIASMPRGQMAPSDNPAYVMVAAAEQCRNIERILQEAGDYVKQGYPGARDVARSYRAAYAVFGAIEQSIKSKRYGEMQDLLRLGFFAGMDEAELRKLCVQGISPDASKQAALDATPADELRSYMLHQQMQSQPGVTMALRVATLNFDKQMVQHGLYSFIESVRQSPGFNAQALINRTQKAAVGTLGGGTALAWMGWLSPEIAIGSALLGTAMASGYWLVEQAPQLSRDQLAQMSTGLAELTRVVDDLERATDAREAAEKAEREAKQHKGRY